MSEVNTTDEVVRHTPGPWHWDSDPVKNDPTGRIRYRVCATGKTVTQVYYSSFEGGPTNAEADARLIAAAPHMSDALRRALSWLSSYPGEGANAAYLQAVAALKKAGTYE